ncbi:hypothetical protein BGX34_003033 [Mortierella sp. NVP85]|nr:hypothetical protein BGX34_003033 [Mortierella sp. NVP85]
MTGKDAPSSPTLYPHAADFTNRPGPPEGGYSWGQIEEAIRTNTLHSLRRTDKGQYEYEQWQAKVDLKDYNNVGEFIAFTILGWPDLKDPADKDVDPQSNWDPEERRKRIEPRLTMRINHYPFPVQESIQYFVLWSTRDMSVPQERERLDLYLRQQFEEHQAPDLLPPAHGKKKQWMWFVNPIELRSVATVHHLHVFVRDTGIAPQQREE